MIIGLIGGIISHLLQFLIPTACHNAGIIVSLDIVNGFDWGIVAGDFGHLIGGNVPHVAAFVDTANIGLRAVLWWYGG